MKCSLKPLLAVSSLLQTVLGIGLTAQPFLLSGQSTVTNAKLSWTIDSNAASYQVKRSIGSNAFTTIATVTRNTFDDYGVPSGGNITYQINALNSAGNSIGSVSNPSDVYLGQAAPSPFQTYSNTQASSIQVSPSKIQLNGLYYQYNYQSDANGFTALVEQTSSDGYGPFTGNRVVLNKATVCAGSDTNGCKIERLAIYQHPSTDEVVMWGHWENNASYSLARVTVAFGIPGGQFNFGGSFRPLGNDSRDLTFFVDNDASGYLISSTRVNADIAIYALTPNWHNITSKVITMLQGQHREAPSMVHVGQYYYLFTSIAAGWYPSAAQYVTATNLAGPWSSGQNVGSLSTFAAQSGGVVQVGDSWAMFADRWAANWKYPEPVNRHLLLPLTFEAGTANMNFYSSVQYSKTASSLNLLGVQRGKIVSVGQPYVAGTTSSVAPYVAAFGNDGISLVGSNYYQPSAVPFVYEVKLATPTAVSQIDLSTRLVGGSETFYTYVVDCINGTTNVGQLVNATQNTVVGFVTSQVTSTSVCTSARLSVSKITNVQNGNSANWAAGVLEFTVYAAPS